MKNDKVYLLTDGCMWEQNKRNKTFYPHAIEVVDIETGQVIFIKSGARIALIEGETTSIRTQEEYNKKTAEVFGNGKSELQRAKSKKEGRATKTSSL